MTWWQQWLRTIEPYVRQMEAWRTYLPGDLSPLQMSLVVTGTFVAIALVIMLAGRLFMGWGQNRLPERERVGSRRPLVLGPLTMAFAWVFPVSPEKQEKLRRDLLSAGYFHRQALEEYLALRNFAALAWLLFTGCAVVVLAGPDETMTPYILGGAAVIFGFLLAVPRIVLDMQSEARRNRIRYSLPDSLDLINMMVTGGMPLRLAVQRARKELHRTHPDIACELAIIDQQAETGSMDQALRQFAARVNVPDVTVLATMVRHAEQIGGNISTAFRDFADSIRRTRRQAAEERGGKSAVKLMFPTVLCLTPPIYMLLLGPAAIELRNFITKENRPGGVLSQSLDPNTSSAVGADPRGQPEGAPPPIR